MVAYFTVRAYGVNQAFPFVESIWLHRKSHQIREKNLKGAFDVIRAQHVLCYHLKRAPWFKLSNILNKMVAQYVLRTCDIIVLLTMNLRVGTADVQTMK